MFKNLVEPTINEPQHFEKGKSYFVTKADGIYQMIRHQAYVAKRKITGYDEGVTIPTLENGSGKELEVVYGLTEKVPFKFIIHMSNFFKKVHKLVGTEASVHLWYLEEGFTLENVINELRSKYKEEPNLEVIVQNFKDNVQEYGNFYAYAPIQRNTSGITVFSNDLIYNFLSDHNKVVTVMETHSHHTMSAFWSGTDVANQQDACYYLVMGRINTHDDMLLKYVHNGVSTDIPLLEVIDIPKFTLTGVDNDTIDLLHLSSQEQYFSGVIPFTEDGFPSNWLGQTNYKMLQGKSNPSNKNNEQYVPHKLTVPVQAVETEEKLDSLESRLQNEELVKKDTEINLDTPPILANSSLIQALLKASKATNGESDVAVTRLYSQIDKICSKLLEENSVNGRTPKEIVLQSLYIELDRGDISSDTYIMFDALLPNEDNTFDEFKSVTFNRPQIKPSVRNEIKKLAVMFEKGEIATRSLTQEVIESRTRNWTDPFFDVKINYTYDDLLSADDFTMYIEKIT